MRKIFSFTLLGLSLLLCGSAEARSHKQKHKPGMRKRSVAVTAKPAFISLALRKSSNLSLESGPIPFNDIEMKSQNIAWSSKDRIIHISEEGIYSIDYCVKIKREGGWSEGEPVKFLLIIDGQKKDETSLNLNDTYSVYQTTHKTLRQLAAGSKIQLQADVSGETNRVFACVSPQEAMAYIVITRIG